MQKIARALNFSETTFIVSETAHEGGFDVRIFTPSAEVPFAGHPTLGTAYVIQRELIQEPVEAVLLNVKIGQIPVRFTYRGGEPDRLWMRQKTPVFGPILEPEAVAPVLGVGRDEVDERFPVQEVSTGLPFIIVPLMNLAVVRKARANLERYYELIREREAKAILLFCPETCSAANDLNARMFGDYYGVPEDPATGSANGCLAAYLVKHRYFGEGRVDVRVEQGYEIGRRSLLLLRASETGAGIEVNVGGRVRPVAEGAWGGS
jgi:trans-2,3-dihydro-3-hydroxyanthranilate isomerase